MSTLNKYDLSKVRNYLNVVNLEVAYIFSRNTSAQETIFDKNDRVQSQFQV